MFTHRNLPQLTVLQICVLRNEQIKKIFRQFASDSNFLSLLVLFLIDHLTRVKHINRHFHFISHGIILWPYYIPPPFFNPSPNLPTAKEVEHKIRYTSTKIHEILIISTVYKRFSTKHSPVAVTLKVIISQTNYYLANLSSKTLF